MSFPNIECARRTNDTFRTRADQLHHKETSLIEELDIDMILNFPTSDSLHLLDLGVMKRCLLRWVFGEKGFTRKWRPALTDLVSRLLHKCAKYVPKEFHRKPRSLKYLRQWKGVEFRLMLLYTGIVILKQSLDDDLYKHFLSLFCAVRICSSEVYKSYQPIAKKLFDSYVKNYGKLYGTHRIGSNVHNLCHIIEDMQHHNVGNLMDLSTYKYENSLRLLGLEVKHGNLPLEQVSRRILEGLKIKSDHQIHLEDEHFYPQVDYEFKFPGQNKKLYKQITIKPGILLSNRRIRDSWFLSEANEIIKMKFEVKHESHYEVVGQKIEQKKSFFESPIDFSKFHIYESSGKVSDNLNGYKIESIKAKLMCLPYKNGYVFIPLLESLK